MNDPGRDKGSVILLAEWIALSAFLENRQTAADAEGEPSLAFVGRAITIALLVVNTLLVNQDEDVPCNMNESLPLQAEHIAVENFVVAIGLDSPMGMEELKKSPELLRVALENVTGVRLSESLQSKKYAIQDDTQTLHKLGLLLYQLFSGGKIVPSSLAGGNDTQPADESNIVDAKQARKREEGFDEGAEDEEKPGAQKGRQKRFIADACKISRKVHISNFEDALLERHVPASICTLLKDLIVLEEENDEAFQSLEEVSAELEQIHVFFSREDNAVQKGVLEFGGGTVGRREEMRCLLEAAAQIEVEVGNPSNPSTLVRIEGDPGIGKSYLVKSVIPTLTQSGWICLSCKFDRLMYDQLSTIASAFETFFRHLVTLTNEMLSNEEAEDVGAILSHVQENLSSSGIVVLSEFMPSLRTLYPAIFASLVDDDSFHSSEEDRDATEDKNIEDSTMDEEIMASAFSRKNRLHYLFKMLVHAISRPNHPLFLWIDDLQWANERSIELLSSLLTDSGHLNNNNVHSFLAVTSYRSNEITPILSRYFEKIDSSALVVVRNILLDAISKSDMNVVVSDALRLPLRQTRALADVLYAKTIGNPLYLQVFMKSMTDEKMLSWSLVQKRWIWSIEAIKATPIDDNVAELLTRKLMRLPKDSQKALKAASCFGVHVEESSLRVLLASDVSQSILPCLERAQEEGILEIEDGLRFTHDMIQEAAYDLMSPEERVGYHYTFGVQLAAQIPLSEEANYFAATDHINRAKALAAIEGLSLDQSMNIEFATLNLTAGNRSMEISDFPSALKYLQYGISFLPETKWDTNYELSLRVYEDACLACYINARPDKMIEFLQEILQNARSFDDKLKGLFVLVQKLTSLGKLKESMNKVFFILDELGESFPESEVTEAVIHDTMMLTKSSLDGVSKEDLIAAPRLNNKRMHWAVKLMAYIVPYVFMLKSSYLSLLACRIVNISTKYGMVSESAFGYLVYGYCHITILHDIEEGYRWGKNALLLLESFDARNLLPKFKVLCYHLNFLWVEPLQAILVALRQCHHEALKVGDNEYASFGAHFYCAQNILCGSFLPTVEAECTALALKMLQLNQLPSCFTHVSNHLSVLMLIGSKKNPFQVFNGHMNSEDELLQHALSIGRFSLAQTIYFNRLFVAFFFKRYEEAQKYAGKYLNQYAKLNIANHIFYTGLTEFYFARHSSNSKHLEIGHESLSSFKTWATHSTWNWENKLLLLEAELYFSKGEMEKAEEKYELAILSARRHRFVHEEGLANELSSAFHTANSNIDKAKSCISEARTCYEKWGAAALVELIDSHGN